MTLADKQGAFADVLRAAAPALRPLCTGVRNLVASLDKDTVIVVWPKLGIASFGIGPRKMTEHYAYLGVQQSHVNLGFYHGTSLRDPAALLEGTGKSLRHIKIRSAAELRNPAISRLLRAAIADRRKHAG